MPPAARESPRRPPSPISLARDACGLAYIDLVALLGIRDR
jgi:hypothetical protein